MATETMIPVQEQRQSVLRRPLRKCFSFPVLMGTALVATNFGIEKSLRMDPDTWWHIKYGDTILQTGHWPAVDTWSFTAHGMPSMAYEWGGEVVTALAYRFGGLQGLDILLIFLTSTIVLLIYYLAWLRCHNAEAAFVGTILLLPVAAMSFTLRPQLLGFCFLLITLICLERFRQGQRNALWVLPPVFLLWVNIHGSFVLGFLVMGLYWLSGLAEFSWGGLRAQSWMMGERIRLELTALICVAMLPITPYGARLAMVPITYAFSLPGNMAHIQEWQPLNLGYWEARVLLILLLAFIIAQISFRLHYRLEELALFFLIAYLTFVHSRFAIIYAMVFAPLAAAILARWMPAYNPKIDKYAINAVLILAALGACVWYFPSGATLEERIASEYPVQAVHYLEQHPIPGRMFNEYAFGGYLVWTGAPGHKVFIDGRGDVYEEAGVFSAYMDVVDIKPDALAVLQSYRVNSCLIYQNSPLATLLAASPNWKLVYKDKLSAIFVRERDDDSSGTHAAGTAVEGKSVEGGRLIPGL
ncbi:MAG TPA: hypothetical protein VNG91_07410 [Terriglobia bacterium]|nr:hypothetical protein [Terriglobia bacterium]